jgi:hypothetical protein
VNYNKKVGPYEREQNKRGEMIQGSSLLLQVALRVRHIRNISIKKAVELVS